MIDAKLLIEKAKEYYKNQYFLLEKDFLKMVEESKVGKRNNNILHMIFKKYIKSYESIKTLEENNLADTEQIDQLRYNLLEDIMVILRSEVEQ